jgi:hypothetical protein
VKFLLYKSCLRFLVFRDFANENDCFVLNYIDKNRLVKRPKKEKQKDLAAPSLFC